MIELKKQNKDLSEKMDSYLDQIHNLESSNKGMATLNKMVEQYKNRAVELETEKFETLFSLQVCFLLGCFGIFYIVCCVLSLSQCPFAFQCCDATYLFCSLFRCVISK